MSETADNWEIKITPERRWERCICHCSAIELPKSRTETSSLLVPSEWKLCNNLFSQNYCTNYTFLRNWFAFRTTKEPWCWNISGTRWGWVRWQSVAHAFFLPLDSFLLCFWSRICRFSLFLWYVLHFLDIYQ